ncbi:anti-sigma factor RsbA family regulatory protein [Actinoplanes sp. NBC_00393]|uniref:anti-sigma factor RsbA family regulatory protein n=1 Tax=Actinoplanes sp. NBC_00393 TaxID=2975953 RepID=UPI002E1D9F58
MTLGLTGVLQHCGLIYRTSAEYLSGAGGFARAALAAGDAVLVAVPEPHLSQLRTELGEAVFFADMAVAGRNPGRIIPGLLLGFAAAHHGRRVSIIAEPVWPARTAIEYPACAAHEAMINAVFEGRDAAILCPYDATRLDLSRLHDAWRTHPEMLVGTARRPSPWFADPFAAAAGFNQPLPDVPPGADTIRYHRLGCLTGIRRFLTARAAAAGLPAARVEDLLIAVNELAQNTLLHTAGGGTVSAWPEPGMLVCQVDDQGYLADPYAGRVRPPARTANGHGLILAHELCDLVRIHARTDGTSIRLHMSR